MYGNYRNEQQHAASSLTARANAQDVAMEGPYWVAMDMARALDIVVLQHKAWRRTNRKGARMGRPIRREAP